MLPTGYEQGTGLSPGAARLDFSDFQVERKSQVARISCASDPPGRSALVPSGRASSLPARLMGMSRNLVMGVAVATALWAAATFWLAPRAPVAAFALLAVCGVLLMIVARAVRAQARRVGNDAGGPRTARLVVTQMLAELTRLQVAFLSKGFASEREGRAWLKRAVPRSFRGALADLGRDLDRARKGERPESLRLPLRVLALKQQLEPIQRALRELSPRYPGYDLAVPLVFVVTENVSVEGEQEPLVRSLAGWDPRRPTLIPEVDLLRVDDASGDRRAGKGLLDLADAARALEPFSERTEEVAGRVVRVCRGLPPTQVHLQLAPMPVGFVVGEP